MNTPPRNHPRKIIKAEAPSPIGRLTNLAPRPRGSLAKAYRRVEKDWDRVEAAATAAQARPSMSD